MDENNSSKILCSDDNEWGQMIINASNEYKKNVFIVIIRHWLGTYLGYSKLKNAYQIIINSLFNNKNK